MRVMAAPDRAALDAIIATDPFAVPGLIAGMTVMAWDSLFGVWGGESSMPGLGNASTGQARPNK